MHQLAASALRFPAPLYVPRDTLRSLRSYLPPYLYVCPRFMSTTSTQSSFQSAPGSMLLPRSTTN
jgi:hypothetical protein